MISLWRSGAGIISDLLPCTACRIIAATSLAGLPLAVVLSRTEIKNLCSNTLDNRIITNDYLRVHTDKYE